MFSHQLETKKKLNMMHDSPPKSSFGTLTNSFGNSWSSFGEKRLDSQRDLQKRIEELEKNQKEQADAIQTLQKIVRGGGYPAAQLLVKPSVNVRAHSFQMSPEPSLDRPSNNPNPFSVPFNNNPSPFSFPSSSGDGFGQPGF